MNRLMLDFETLDVAECPVILSMGAVVFNENRIIATLYHKVDQQSCLDLGCTISESTIEWWDAQSEEAREAAFGGKLNIAVAMQDLVDLYKNKDCGEIWSRGALADIRWANNILEKMDIEKPWKFWEEMCFRTFLKYSPEFVFCPDGVKHNALDDAANQAEQWIAINQMVATPNFIGIDVSCIGDQDVSLNVISDEKLEKNKRLYRFVQDVLDLEWATIEDIKNLSAKIGYKFELIGGDEKHGSYSIYENPDDHIISITKCHCDHIHLLEDMCAKCNPYLVDNFLGNGTPIAKFESDNDGLPF